jgi:hypothetical protein
LRRRRRPSREQHDDASPSLTLLAHRGGRGSHEAERPLKVALLPDDSPASIVRKNQPLRDELASTRVRVSRLYTIASSRTLARDSRTEALTAGHSFLSDRRFQEAASRLDAP